MDLVVRDLGRSRYAPVLAAMRAFTDRRHRETVDELWLTEHEPVFTQGQAGKAEFVLNPGEIPVVQSDRGGQVTYHGPGQIVGYALFDLRRMERTVRGLVSGIEASMIEVLSSYGIHAVARPDAPGVYVDGVKVGALGLRVRKGCSYHGLALNVDLDLEPFTRINPCGLGVPVTSIAELLGTVPTDAKARLVHALVEGFGFTRPRHTSGNWDSLAV